MPHKFKDRDVRRLIKSAREAGLNVGRVSVNPRTGELSVIARQPGEAAVGGPSVDDTPEAIISRL